MNPLGPGWAPTTHPSEWAAQEMETPQTMPEEIDNDVSDEENANLQHLRDKAAEADELRTLLAARDRKDAIRDAGIDLESEAGKLLLENGELDIARVVALLPSADAVGEENEVSDEEKNLSADRRAVATGAEGDSTPAPENPYGKPMYTAYDAARVAGKTSTQAMSDAVALIRKAGQDGDARVLYDPANPTKRYTS